jgi:CheY-like chemotaxis protein
MLQKELKILCVDDEQVLLEVYRRVFEQNHFKVVTATNGKECIAVAHKEKPDLILLDNKMPVMGGLEATVKLRKTARFRDIPIIMLSTTNNRSEVIEALRAGCTGFFTKNANLCDIPSQLSRHLIAGHIE